MNPALKILLVDDDPDDRALVRRALSNGLEGVEVREAASAEAFAAALAEWAPDVLVTDYRLRWTDGLAVVAAARRAAPELAAIMYTGTGDEGIAVEAMKAGLDDYVVKSAAHLRRLPGAVKAAVDRLHARAALEARTRELRHAERMAALGRVAGGVAHDFNNLLTIMLGGLDDATTAPGLPAAARAALEDVRGAATRGAALTRKLLAFGGQRPAAVRLIELDRVVGEAVEFLRRLLGADVRLRFTRGPERLLVRADPLQIEQVLVNLAVNARDAMPSGGAVAVSTAAVASATGPCAELVVADDGAGMTPAVLRRIFEPFFTTKPEGVGTGLGLAVVKGIVDELGGVIDVRSDPGVGTSFRLLLPRVAETSDAPARGARPEAERPRATPPSRGRALVVDDEAGVRTVVARLLAHCGFATAEAEGETEGRRRLAEWGAPPDLLVVDLGLRHGNGVDVAAALGAAHGVPTLLVSGLPDVPRRADARQAFLAKPFDLSTLRRAVDALCGASAAEAAGGGGGEHAAR